MVRLADQWRLAVIPAVASALDTIVGAVTALQKANGAGRAYELYIMTAIADELRTRGCDVVVLRSDGSAVAPGDTDRKFIQRGGVPTGIFPGSAGADNASCFRFRKPSSTQYWEIWNGIQFRGRSGGTHEIDIAIVPHEVGIMLRSYAIETSPIGRPAVAIECKDVGGKGSADEMRAFVARLYDLTILGVHSRVPHLTGARQRIYPGAPPGNDSFQHFWEGNRRTLNVIARRTGFAAGATAMTSYYAIQPRGPVFPGTVEDADLTNEVSDWVMTNLV